MIGHPIVVLDDDPTGTQTMAGVPVVLRLDETTMRAVAATQPRAVHLITNSRAEDPADASRFVDEVARLALAVWPDAELVLRGDSTLRGHVWEEYDAVRSARAADAAPVLLLAPALPSAGRVTIDGMHLLERDGVRSPLHDTEYARDPALGYRTARLLDWAEERSAGRLAARDGAEVHLAELHRDGATAVTGALAAVAERGRPACCAVDAESDDDLRLAVDGFVEARRQGVPVVLRCAPAAAGLLSGATAEGDVAVPTGTVLVVCGSFVPTATRQLRALVDTYPGVLVEADVAALTGAAADAEVARLVTRLGDDLRERGLAVVATPRTGGGGAGGLDRQRVVATRLADVVRALPRPPDVLVTKGGVTSAVTVRDGLGATRADVVGPVETGVGRWDVVTTTGTRCSCLVVPGNVGDDEVLVRLVAGAAAVTQPGPT